MKNVFKAFGIVVLMAVIGFSMAACDDGNGGGGGGGGGDGLAGTTWTYTESGGSATLTFIDSSKVKMGTYNGTYTFNGSSGTINWDDGERDTFTVNGNQFTMGGYTFTKTGSGSSGDGGTLSGTYKASDGDYLTISSNGNWSFVWPGDSSYSGKTYRIDGERLYLYRDTYTPSTPEPAYIFYIINSNTLRLGSKQFVKQ